MNELTLFNYNDNNNNNNFIIQHHNLQITITIGVLLETNDNNNKIITNTLH